MKASLILLTIFATPIFALADAKWSGNGEVFSVDGKQIGTYQIEVVETQVSADTIQNKSMVTLNDGSVHSDNQIIKSNGNTWTVTSDFGTGGGSCYGQDICENYIQGAKGLAVATTIIRDGELNRRNLTVVLENGRALKVYKDKMTKIQ